MKMQHLDYDAIYIPGKTNVTDYISRHPLPTTEKDRTEKHVYAAVTADHAIVWDKIKSATQGDKEMKLIAETIQNGRWEDVKQMIKPYYEIRAELFVIDGVIMRMDRIVPPESLRQRIAQAAHKQGHLGVNKTKTMIRRKYWFPGMDSRIEDVVQSCFDCQIATDEYHTEPAKMSPLPERPWEIVEADFCGPLPNNKYALVITDQYSRYPEVEIVTSTAIGPVIKKMKKIFATHGIPCTLQTDNGPPFNGKQFEEFAQEMGFHHKKITPRHPKAQGQVENFNKLINKTTKIAYAAGVDIENAIFDMLHAYIQTPHPATKLAPYELLMKRRVRTRLEHFPTEVHINYEELKKNDEFYKKQRKGYHDKRHRVKRHRIQLGDAVVIKREKKTKKDTPYEPYIYIVTRVRGSTIQAARLKDGKVRCRDASKVKLLRTRHLVVSQEEPSMTVPSEYRPRRDSVEKNTGNGVQEDLVEGHEVQEKTVMEQPSINKEGGEVEIEQFVPRRSTRNKKSVYQGKYKDYVKS